MKPPRVDKHEQPLKFIINPSNNEEEYESLIVRIELYSDLFKVYSDSQLVVSQLNGECEVKDDTMNAYAH